MTATLERRALLQELVVKGIRMTTQRRAVLEVIQGAKEHLDADALLERARKRQPNIDRATVYRTIELLHLACFRCGQIEEYSSPLFERLKAEIGRQAEFQIKVTRLEVGGSCRA